MQRSGLPSLAETKRRMDEFYQQPLLSGSAQQRMEDEEMVNRFFAVDARPSPVRPHGALSRIREETSSQRRARREMDTDSDDDAKGDAIMKQLKCDERLDVAVGDIVVPLSEQKVKQLRTDPRFNLFRDPEFIAAVREGTGAFIKEGTYGQVHHYAADAGKRVIKLMALNTKYNEDRDFLLEAMLARHAGTRGYGVPVDDFFCDRKDSTNLIGYIIMHPGERLRYNQIRSGDIRDISKAVQRMHLDGISHWDLHWGNVLRYDSRIAIIDFGFATLCRREAAGPRDTPKLAVNLRRFDWLRFRTSFTITDAQLVLDRGKPLKPEYDIDRAWENVDRDSFAFQPSWDKYTESDYDRTFPVRVAKTHPLIQQLYGDGVRGYLNSGPALTQFLKGNVPPFGTGKGLIWSTSVDLDQFCQKVNGALQQVIAEGTGAGHHHSLVLGTNQPLVRFANRIK